MRAAFVHQYDIRIVRTSDSCAPPKSPILVYPSNSEPVVMNRNSVLVAMKPASVDYPPNLAQATACRSTVDLSHSRQFSPSCAMDDNEVREKVLVALQPCRARLDMCLTFQLYHHFL